MRADQLWRVKKGPPVPDDGLSARRFLRRAGHDLSAPESLAPTLGQTRRQKSRRSVEARTDRSVRSSRATLTSPRRLVFENSSSSFLPRFCLFIYVSLSIGVGVESLAGTSTLVTSEADALRYLTRFGYIAASSEKVPDLSSSSATTPTQTAPRRRPNSRARIASQTFSNLRLGGAENEHADVTTDAARSAVAEFQKMAGLAPTGVLDAATLAMMNAPRCGVKDKFASKRSKRYLLQGSKWRNKDLTYKISQYLPNLSKAQVDKVIYRAFKVWGDHSGLTFTQKDDGKVHINILFVSGEHGDGEPFDGKGGTLAHAYFPMFGGDAHFDADEVWTIQSKSGINLFIVAAHEIGHSLGLLHTDVRQALMAPFYRGYTPDFKLHRDDIQAIQRLYGPPSSGFSIPDKEAWFHSSYGTKPTKSTTVSNNEITNAFDICLDPRIDALTRTAEGNTFAFKGDLYWLVEDAGYAKGYPRRIGQDWDGLPGNLNAALTWRDGRTFFFKGDSYWRFSDGKKMDKGYPKKISAGFAGLPSDLDAAFVWSGNGKTYFFKDGQYWRYGASTRGMVDPGYPKPLTVWDGLPLHIDAAFQWKNGKTYFFSEETYFRFNDKDLKVDSSFPRPVSSWWFGCGDISNSALMLPPFDPEEALGRHPRFRQRGFAAALTSGAASRRPPHIVLIQWTLGFDKLENLERLVRLFPFALLLLLTRVIY